MSNHLKPVTILSQTPAPPSASIDVTLHYFQAGVYHRLTVPTRPPTYFDDIVISTVHETLPIAAFSPVPANSLRNLARNAVYTSRNLSHTLARSTTFSVPVLDMRGLEPGNMAHLLTDIIPYFLLAKAAVGGDIQLLLLRDLHPPFSALLNFFGITPRAELRQVTGDILKVRGTRGLSVYDLFGTFDYYGIHAAPDIYSAIDIPAKHPFDRIFLARRSPRNLGNQAEVEALTTRYGYKTIFMEDYPVDEQLSIAANAKHVIAVHGAAMSQLLLNDNIASVIELFTPNVHHQLYPACLASKVARYDQIVSGFDPTVAHNGWAAISSFKSRNFSVDVELLQTLLSEIH